MRGRVGAGGGGVTFGTGEKQIEIFAAANGREADVTPREEHHCEGTTASGVRSGEAARRRGTSGPEGCPVLQKGLLWPYALRAAPLTPTCRLLLPCPVLGALEVLERKAQSPPRPQAPNSFRFNRGSWVRGTGLISIGVSALFSATGRSLP